MRFRHYAPRNRGPIETATWNPASIADGDNATTTVTVVGAELGDFCIASFSLDLSGLAMYSYVSAADTVTVGLLNNTGAPVDLGSGTVKVQVYKI